MLRKITNTAIYITSLIFGVAVLLTGIAVILGIVGVAAVTAYQEFVKNPIDWGVWGLVTVVALSGLFIIWVFSESPNIISWAWGKLKRNNNKKNDL